MDDGSENPIGRTKDTGWQVGVRRTYTLTLERAWELVTSDDGLGIWLGEVTKLNREKGAAYELSDGTFGEIRVYKPSSHLRLTYQPPDWRRASTIQVRVLPSGAKTQIAFHQENMPDQTARVIRKEFFLSAHEKLAGLIEASDP